MEEKWTQVDEAVATLIRKWMSETTPRTTLQRLAIAIGTTRSSLQPILSKRRKASVRPLSTGLWMKCIFFFKKNPGVAMLQALELAALNDGNKQLAAQYHAAWDNRKVQDAIVTLAVEYLNTRDAANHTPPISK